MKIVMGSDHAAFELRRKLAERLRAVDPNTLSPLEALRLLFELKNDLG